MKKYRTFFFATVFWLISSPSALGCLCDGIPSVAEELRDASVVFSGKFVSAEYTKGIVNGLRRMEEEATGKKVEYEVLVLKFQVERWWKGNSVGEVILVTNLTRDPDGTEHILDCEYPFKVGERYLVYAYGEENELGTSTCTRTRKLKKAKEDLKVLGEGRKPENGSAPPLKDTVIVEPRWTLAFEFLADNPGGWLFHCHHAYHLAAGMARVFKYV